ncbi:MAG: beta-propeller fold lactonase family protein, partial [Terracidiphilus sp.]
MNQRIRTLSSAGLAALAAAVLTFAFWSVINHPVRADESGTQDYASPLEVLLSPDGARLYVLCQQSEEVRVLDATSYAVIKNIAVGRVPRGFSLSHDGARLFVANSWDDTL